MTCLKPIIMTTLLWLAFMLLLWQPCYDLLSWKCYDNLTLTCLNAIVMTTLLWLPSNILLWQPCQDIMVLRLKFKRSAIWWPSGGVCLQCMTMTKSYLLIFVIFSHPQLPNQSDNSYNFYLCQKVSVKRENTISSKSWQYRRTLKSRQPCLGAYWRPR